MDAGLIFGGNAVTFDETQMVAAPLTYESIVIDTAGQPSTPAPDYALSAPTLLQQSQSGAAARASIRTAGLARFRNPDASRAVRLRPPRWLIASMTDTATTAPLPSADATWSEIRAEVAALNRRAPTGFAQWQLLPQYEIPGQ